MHDFRNKAYFQNTPKNTLRISLEKRDFGGDLIIVGQDPVLLAENIKMTLIDTPFNDALTGNCENNLIISRRGNDYLEGKAGQDVYCIE